jgi:SAM-dependent methyltransferase
MSEERPYEGKELELFSLARNWKNYWSNSIRSHFGSSVLEVGAGLGTNTPYLLSSRQTSWLCLEPDSALMSQIPATLANHPQRDIVQARMAFLADLPASETFDTILYIDVLEHIEHDHAEMRTAVAHLKPGGKIIVLSPAQPSLYTDFDRALGHYRRYTRATLSACTPDGARLIKLFALDSFGLMASVANKLLLHQSIPTQKQILFWDRCLVPISRLTDPLIGYSLGKSLIGIWQKS